MAPAAAPVVTRRRVLQVGSGVVGALAFGSAGYGLGEANAAPAKTTAKKSTTPTPSTPAPSSASYVSQPEMAPPLVTVTAPATNTAPGLIMTTPSITTADHGPLIIDNSGSPVWFRPLSANTMATNLRVQSYRGKPVLTWWQGAFETTGWGRGEYVVVDQQYRQVARVAAGDGLYGDLHDFVLTDRGTALLVVYHPTTADLTSVGGAANAPLLDSGVQEIDLATGKVVFEWLGHDHVDISESHNPRAAGTPWDFLHVNAVAVDLDGNLLVSARHTWTIYKINRTTGDVLWRLGGTKSDFTFSTDAAFAWQHDVARQADGTITLFDNHEGSPTKGQQSRGMVLQVDEASRTASLVKAYPHPTPLLAATQGSMEVLPDGGAFVGWGQLQNLTEFAPDGSVRFDATFPTGGSSYRAFRSLWTAQPQVPPAVVARTDDDGSTNAYVSWNGATEVVTWQLVGGAASTDASLLASQPRSGFETKLPVPDGTAFVAAVALDASGKELGRSRPIRT